MACIYICYLCNLCAKKFTTLSLAISTLQGLLGLSKAQIRQTLPLDVSALDQSSHLPPLTNVYGVRFGVVVRRPRIDGGNRSFGTGIDHSPCCCPQVHHLQVLTRSL